MIKEEEMLRPEGGQLGDLGIQWFPGHMAKTRRLMAANLKLVDAAAELIDARIPVASRNPEIQRILGQKPRIILLNKAGLADERITRQWIAYYQQKGVPALAIDCKSGSGISQIAPLLRRVLAQLLARRAQRGMQTRPIRLMIVGVPNVGKSSLINRLAGSKRAKVEDRPGVTRGKQWVSLESGMELLDMPGVLWPKFEDPAVGERLAFTGAVKDDVLDVELLALKLLLLLREEYSELLCQRYKLTREELAAAAAADLLELVGRKRGMLLGGGAVNTERAAITVLDEFRGGRIGRISLERPPKEEEACV